MLEEKIIRKFPLFELFVENNHLIVNNYDHLKDNCVINIKDISHLELIKKVSFFDKIIEVYFGVIGFSKSNELRIHLKNSFKDIILTNCDISKVELIIYKINHSINELANKTKTI
ncbi:hypothetical protein OX283_001820 [Flavobacterium sp. SUN052]|uniref:hypothetical protein n=1 Tax=Flavobacterium sp. SUN052 TaxID=3002441 RepID=UPI00237E8B83|nr:hypothetical protein [Flavobacterium sp. SUN052]MEC4003380.1 hypothetical protein [Flavobacterium sp. SUN052]